MYRWTILLFLFQNCFILSSQSSLSQAGNHPIGTPFIRNYTTEEYGAHNQNWWIVQDDRGVMYFANGSGIMEYDGVTWSLMPDKTSSIRSMTKGEDGRIYIGAYDDFGYLEPDANHQFHFVSLLSKTDTMYRDFGDVWHLHATKDGVYFVSKKFLFRWNGSEIKVWKPSTVFHSGHAVNGKMYVMAPKTGILEIVGDSLVLIPQGEFYEMTAIRAMLPYGKNKILFAPLGKPFTIYDGKSFTPFPTEADEIISKGQLYCATTLPNGDYAFGTLQDGVVVIDPHGKLKYHLNKSSGLQGETIYYLKSDNEGNLWIAMHLGLSRAELNIPFTQFTDREGIEGSALHIERNNGKLYAATSMGVYLLDESPGANRTPGRFKRVEGVSPQAWDLASFGNDMIAATFQGVWLISGNKVTLIDSAYAVSLHQSKQDPNRIFVGMQRGIEAIYHNNGRWKEEAVIKGIEDEVLDIYESSPGTLWLTTRYASIYRMEFPDGFNLNPVITHFDTSAGLPTMDRTIVFSCPKGDCFGTTHGVYLFDEAKGRFYPDTTIVKGLNNNDTRFFTVSENADGDLWMISTSKSGLATRNNDNTYTWSADPFLRIGSIDLYHALPDPSNKNITWFGALDRVYKYDASVAKETSTGFKTLIRKIISNGDSTLYGGSGDSLDQDLSLSHRHKSIRFLFAAPTFSDESKTEYQYKLEGYDSEWSNWSKETYKDYTGLPKGEYQFLVRSRNLYNQVGETASVKFEMLPPFYFSTWAYLFYFIFFGGLVYLAWRINLGRIQKEHSRELKVLEYEKLKELDHLKSQFFADISHEFRTPLTLILGPVENLLSENPTPDNARQYTLIKRNAQRLLRLINQLLDLSKLEAGKMKLDLVKADIVPVISGIVNSFESLAQSKKLQLSTRSNIEKAYLLFDRDKMEQVITNLISNAIKFTANGGKINVEVSENEKDQRLLIEVTDTGSGISKEQLAHVFDRFYQGDEASRTGEPGTGIGLALAKELVELHKGTIKVQSTQNVGTSFTISLPYKKEAFPQPAEASKNGTSAYMPDELTINSVVNLIEEQELTSDNTLLLVEDNPDMRGFIREILTGSYRVIEAVDGEDGMEKAFTYIPDIIISDVMMPRKDGLQLCMSLKQDERTSHIPVILLTAKADIESRLAGLERGADDYLAKPFNREELLVRSRNLLDIRKQLRDRYSSLQQLPSTENKNLQIEDAFLLRIKALVEDNLSESGFEIDQLSRLAGMSRSQLFRKIKALTGQSPSMFIRTIRLHKAKDLLQNTNKNVSEVAYEVGFSSPAYFSDAFTETYGIRPSQVKK